jgi:hypothetical protein
MVPPQYRGWRYPEFVLLEIGQGFLVHWIDLTHCNDPAHAIRNNAYQWSRRLGRRFVTHKTERGMQIMRVA